MSDPISIFWKRMQASGLLDPSRFESVQKQVEAARLDDVKAIAKWLIGQDVLTRFQAKALLAAPKTPLSFGDYVVTDELADAPFEDAYRIKHVPTGHELMAVLHKAAHLSALDNPAALGKVQQRLLADRPIHQAQCAKAYEVIRKGDLVLVVADVLTGETLRQRIARGKLSPSEASSIAVQVAMSLAAWHEAGVAHADVCPENVVLSSDGGVRLWHDPLRLPAPLLGADVATLRELEQRAAYLAPELDVQQAPYSHLTDLYALGAVYFEILAGEPALKRDSLMATMQAHASERIPELSAQGIPKPLEQIVTYLMAKRPDVRYQEATAVADQIARFSETPIDVPPPPMPLATTASYEAWIERRSPLQLGEEATTANVAGTPNSGVPVFAAAAPAMGAASDASANPVSHNSPARMIEARKKAQKRQRIILAVVASLGLVGGLVGLVIYLRQPGTNVARPSDNTNENPDNGENDGGEGTGGSSDLVDTTAAVPQKVVDDDGALLWESPTQGDPLSLAGIPDGPRGVIVLRPSELLAGNAGIALTEALGPDFGTWRSTWEDQVGINLDQASRVVISLHDADSPGMPYAMLTRVELAAPADSAALKSRWGDAGFSEGSGNVWRSGDLALAVVASDTDGRVSAFAAGPLELVDLAVAKGTSEPVLAPDQRLLVPQVDGARHITVLLTVTNLYSEEGQAWLGGRWLPLAEIFEPVLFDGIQSFALSIHRDTDWYLELTATKRVGQTAEQLVAKWEANVGTWGNQLEAGIAEVPQHPYWERVRLRFPAWMRDMLGNLRFGVEDNVARANVWLPDPAGPNLVTGTELILASLTDPTVDTGAPEGPAETVPTNIDELLQSKVDFAVS
ncbi:MAG: protein kinase, partial [Planctomycetales bacterium]|nr:protein kinase [Planctomycetales bacterium]